MGRQSVAEKHRKRVMRIDCMAVLRESVDGRLRRSVSPRHLEPRDVGDQRGNGAAIAGG